MNTSIKKIGIIGCGWLGLPLAKAFIKQGYDVLGSTTNADKLSTLRQAGIQPFLLKLPEEISVLKELVQVDYLIINIPPGRRDPRVLESFPKKIQLLFDSLNAVTKFIFVSSTSVYGENKRKVSEQDEPLPLTNSAKALRRVEEYIEKKYLPNKMACILRPSGLIGPGRFPGRFLAGKQNLPNGDAPINLIHQEDLINVIVEITRQNHFGEIFNVSADKHPTKMDFYNWATVEQGLKPPAYKNGGADSKVIDNSKVKSILNYSLIFADPYRVKKDN